MKNIKDWMKHFSENWINYDIDGVLSLFTKDVEYWESPYEKFEIFQDLKNAWGYIKTQRDISFEYVIFGQDEEKYTIDWNLGYINLEGEKENWSGIYILKLNDDNKCYFFKQVGELKQ